MPNKTSMSLDSDELRLILNTKCTTIFVRCVFLQTFIEDFKNSYTSGGSSVGLSADGTKIVSVCLLKSSTLCCFLISKIREIKNTNIFF